MEQTADRIRQIKRIVRHEPVGTQGGLVRALARHGIRVTQATVSRDIKRLGLVKVPDGGGRYRYALPGATAEAVPASAEQRLRIVTDEYALEVIAALDLVLVKTERGGAAPVAQAIDDMRWPDIAGTLAGEDTIIVVPRSRAATRSVLGRLRALITAG